VLLPVRSSQLCRANEPCLSKLSNPRLAYHAVSFDLVNGGRRWSPLGEVQRVVELDQPGRFRHYRAGATKTSTVSVDSAEAKLTRHWV